MGLTEPLLEVNTKHSFTVSYVCQTEVMVMPTKGSVVMFDINKTDSRYLHC